MRANGVLSEAGDDETTPFAVVTTFTPDVRFSLRQASMAQLAEAVDAMLPSKNLFHALKVHGSFAAMNTRAIAKQFLPYPPRAEVTVELQVLRRHAVWLPDDEPFVQATLPLP